MPERLALHALYKESGGLANPNEATSSKGAQGIMQIMPRTAKELGVENPRDPEQSAEGSMRYLRKLLDQFGDERLAAAAYNAGPGNVRKYKGVPPFAETQNYVATLAKGGIASFDKGGKSSYYGAPADDDTVSQPYYSTPIAADRTYTPPDILGGLRSLFSSRTRPFGYDAASTPAARASQADVRKVDAAQGFSYGVPSDYTPPRPPPAVNPFLGAQDLPSPVDTDTLARTIGETTQLAPSQQAQQAAPESALSRYINEYKAQLQSDRDDAKRQAMLTAAAAMLGGTSPFAGVNIGKGVLAGMADLQAAAKQAGVSERTLANMLVNQEHYAAMERVRQQGLQERKEMEQAKLEAAKSPDAMLSKVATAIDRDPRVLSLKSRIDTAAKMMDKDTVSTLHDQLEALVGRLYADKGYTGFANPTGAPATKVIDFADMTKRKQ